MPNDTTAALQALITQVKTLTTTVTDQQKRMDGLYEHNSRLLDQVKDVKREKQTSASPSDQLNRLLAKLDKDQQAETLKSAGLQQNPDGAYSLAGSQPPGIYLTREGARDPQKYADAKAQAEAECVPLRVMHDGEDPTRRNIGQHSTPLQSKVFTFDDDHERIRYVRADMNTGSGIVSRRMQAERDGYRVQSFTTLDDLPDHARTKFELMERAANADSDT